MHVNRPVANGHSRSRFRREDHRSQPCAVFDPAPDGLRSISTYLQDSREAGEMSSARRSATRPSGSRTPTTSCSCSAAVALYCNACSRDQAYVFLRMVTDTQDTLREVGSQADVIFWNWASTGGIRSSPKRFPDTRNVG